MLDAQAAYALALVAALAFGGADFLGGLSTRRVGLRLTALSAQLAACVILGVGTLGQPGSPSMSDLAWSVAAGVADCAGLLLLFRALSIGKMAGVAPTAGLVSSALPIVVGFALGERPAFVQWLGIGLGLLAIVVISWEPSDGGTAESGRVLPIVLAVAAGAGFAIYYIVFAHISSESGVTPVLTARIASAVLVVAWVASGRDRLSAGLSTYRPSRLGLAIGAGVLAAGGNLLFVLAVRQGELGVVSLLASLYPAVTAILAITFLGERPRVVQLAGIGAAVTAVGMIAAG